MTIKQIAFFGDSYCYDSRLNPMSMLYENHHYGSDLRGNQTQTYIDMLSEKLNLPVVHHGISGHGPNWTMHELITWLKRGEYNPKETFFIFCWSDPCRDLWNWDIQDEKIKEEHRGFDDKIHPGEFVAVGPDAPCIDEFLSIMPERVQAIKLWWLYLRNENQYWRYWEQTKLAFKQLVYEYDIQYKKEFFCFPWTSDRPNEVDFSFYYNNIKFTNLYHFAQHFDDYGVQGVDDLHYRNHFSDIGHVEMTSLLEEEYRRICE